MHHQQCWIKCMHVLRWTHLLHLALRNSPAVVNNARGLESGGFVELNEQLAHHVGEILDDLLAKELLLGQILAGRLHPYGGAVSARVSVHTAHHCSNGRLLPVTRWRVSDVCT